MLANVEAHAPRCSIVVPVYNRASLTRQCLNALLAEPPGVAAEIVVVDDGSRDLTPRLLAGYGDRIRVVAHAANQGFAAACNDGAAAAAGEYLVFLNNDTLPRAGWLDALVRHADAHPKAAVVGSKLLHPNGTVQHAGLAICQDRWPRHVYRGFPADHPAVNKSRRFQAVTGACMLVRRAAFEAAGGFDRAFVNGHEDVDLCLRLGQRGHEVHYSAESELVYLGSMTGSPDEMNDPLGDNRLSDELFRKRWAGRVEPDEVRFFLEDGLVSLKHDPATGVHVDVSPQLGTVGDGEREREADRLIGRYAVRLFDLTRERDQLRARVSELDFRQLAIVQDGGAGFASTWHQWLGKASILFRREFVASLYLQGRGIELGALHAPLDTPRWVKVRYVDRMTVAELREQYPELRKETLVEPDIIDDAERLETVEDGSQDFVIANHFIEHCEDPIGAIGTILRVLKPGGVAYLAIPDKRFTFDAERPVTPIDHLLRDHREGPSWSRRQHFEEWARLVMHKDGEEAVAETEKLLDMDYSVHFHVWSEAELLELFARLQRESDFAFEVELVFKNHLEIIFILRKNA
jgi:GT2 family glycosyltransferase/SAM-dependent methyltransferase